MIDNYNRLVIIVIIVLLSYDNAVVLRDESRIFFFYFSMYVYSRTGVNYSRNNQNETRSGRPLRIRRKSRKQK